MQASDAADCTVIPVGLSDVNEIIKLNVDPSDEADTSAMTIGDLRPKRALWPTHVPAYRLDDYADTISVNVEFARQDRCRRR